MKYLRDQWSLFFKRRNYFSELSKIKNPKAQLNKKSYTSNPLKKKKKLHIKLLVTLQIIFAVGICPDLENLTPFLGRYLYMDFFFFLSHTSYVHFTDFFCAFYWYVVVGWFTPFLGTVFCFGGDECCSHLFLCIFALKMYHADLVF